MFDMPRSLFALFLLSAASGSYIFAGSADATLQCKSLSGRTKLTATIQDIDGTVQDASVTVDGEPITFTSSDSSAAIFDATHGVYTISITGAATKRFPNGRFLRFWAIPRTFKTAGTTADGKNIWTFSALLECTEPRKDKELLITPRIEIQCTLIHGI